MAFLGGRKGSAKKTANAVKTTNEQNNKAYIAKTVTRLKVLRGGKFLEEFASFRSAHGNVSPGAALARAGVSESDALAILRRRFFYMELSSLPLAERINPSMRAQKVAMAEILAKQRLESEYKSEKEAMQEEAKQKENE